MRVSYQLTVEEISDAITEYMQRKGLLASGQSAELTIVSQPKLDRMDREIGTTIGAIVTIDDRKPEAKP